MDAHWIAVSHQCLAAGHDGNLAFPAIVGKLIDAGFESDAVDYRRNSQTFYLPDGDNIEIDMPHSQGAISAVFDEDGVAVLARWAQAGAAEYNYAASARK